MLIVPCRGLDKNLAKHIEAFFKQDFPCFRVITVVETDTDPAYPVLYEMAKKYSHLDVIRAGKSQRQGQKNRNLLAGVAAAAPRTKVLVFTDSDHQPDPYWLRRMVAPLRGNFADIVTGYRRIRPKSRSLVPMVYALFVGYLRAIMGVPAFQSLWGGAVALRKSTFKKLQVARLWENAVVDDVPLAELARRSHTRILFRPDCVFEEEVTSLRHRDFSSWALRQVQFLRFFAFHTYFLVLWVQSMGIYSFLSIPLLVIVGTLVSVDALTLLSHLLLAIGWVGVGTITSRDVEVRLPLWRLCLATIVTVIWVWGLLCHGFFSRTVKWRGLTYKVDRLGQVLPVKRESSAAGSEKG